MKRVLWIGAAALMLLGCEKAEEVLTLNTGETRTISAIIDNQVPGNTASRIDIHPSGGVYSHYWQDEDAIKVFNDASGSASFTIENGIGTSDAEFSGSLDGTITGAVYPATNEGASYDGTSFTVTFPAVQTYTANTYDKNANIYVAAGSVVNSLVFKPVMSYIKLAYYSASASVDSIVVTAIGGEKIAGAATVSKEGVIAMDESAVSSIRLNCPTPVVLSTDSEAPTYFYVALPAVTISSGLEVRVYSTVSEAKTFLFRNIATAPLRNRVLEMPALNYAPLASSAKATLVVGEDFNRAIKGFLSGSPIDTSSTENNNVERIVFQTSKDTTGLKKAGAYVVVSDPGKDGPEIIATWNSISKTITIQTPAPNMAAQIYRNMFREFREMTELVGFENVLAPEEPCSAQRMFAQARKLKSLDLSCITNEITSSYSMFVNCQELVEIKGIENINFKRGDSNSLQTCYMFQNCYKLEGDLSLKISYMYNPRNMFENCRSLRSIDLSDCFTHSTTATAELMFKGCTTLVSITFPNNNATLRSATSMRSFFDGDKNLTTLVNFDKVHSSETSKEKSCTDFSYMFNGCSSLTSVDLSKLVTSKATTMSHMFDGMEKIETLDLRNFDTKLVEDFSYMFYNCSSLTSLDMSGENCSAAKATTLQYLWRGCVNLEVAKFGSNFTNAECSLSYASPNPANFQTHTILKFYCNPTFAQRHLGLSYIRTMCNNGEGLARIRFYSIAKYLADESDAQLVLDPTYGSVTNSTTVTEPL